MALPTIAGEFIMAAPAEMKYLPSGTAAVRLRLVAKSRRKGEDGTWVDDKRCWITAVAYGDVAEHITESTEKGDLIEVRGRLVTEEYTDRNGNARQDMRIMVDGVGASLRFRTLRHSKYAQDRQEAMGAAPGGEYGPAPAERSSERTAPDSGAKETAPPF